MVGGAVAAATGTAAMDLYGYARHRAGGGTSGLLRWEFGGEQDWDKVSAPAQVGRRLVEGFTQRPLSARWAVLTQNLTQWAYGTAWGAGFGVVVGSLARRRLAFGPVFGSTVWLSGYAVLPLGGLYKPIWEYDAPTLAADLGGHLVFGTVTAGVFKLLV